MYRWRAATVGVACLGLPGTFLVLLSSSPAGASGISVHVTPSRGLVDGKTVTVSGRGLARTYGGKPLTWFLAECTDSVQVRMNPSNDTPHCDVTEAKAIRLSSRGTFSTRFKVETGIVGDGYCGSDGHDTCVISVGNARGQGTVVHITFHDAAASTPSSTSTTVAATATAPPSTSTSTSTSTTAASTPIMR
jgi:Neocarzinostatin family